MDTKLLVGIVIAVVVVAGAAALMEKGGGQITTTSPLQSQSATQTSTETTTSAQTTGTTSSSTTTTTTQTTTTKTTKTSISSTTTATTSAPETTTATQTHTTTSSSTATLKSYSDIPYVLKTFTHMKYVFSFENKTTGETSAVEISYTVHNKQTETINGQEAVRVDFSLVQPDNPENNGNITVWFTPDYTQMVRVVAESEGQTQTIEGPQLQYISQQLRYMLFSPILAVGHLSLMLTIEEAKLAAAKNGWDITSTKTTTVTISGNSYKAIEGTAINVGDAEATAKEIKVTVANLEDNAWYIVNLEWTTKDNGHGKIQLTELTKA